MSKVFKIACVIICILFAARITTAQSNVRKPAAEPTVFYEDCDEDSGAERPCLFKDSVVIPDNVLNALRASDEAKSMQGELKDYDRDDFAQLFRAVVIHLGSSKETDYVLLSEFPLGGADAPWFWIVRSHQSHPKVIFFTFANGFQILKTRNNGYPDIRSNAYAGGVKYTNIYHYNGQQYALVHKYQIEMKE